MIHSRSETADIYLIYSFANQAYYFFRLFYHTFVCISAIFNPDVSSEARIYFLHACNSVMSDIKPLSTVEPYIIPFFGCILPGEAQGTTFLLSNCT